MRATAIAGGFFAVTQDLAQESPKDDCRVNYNREERPVFGAYITERS